MKTCAFFLLSVTALFGQYKMEPGGAPPPELAPAVSATLQQPGTKIVDAGGNVVCEVWIRTSIPAGAGAAEPNVAFPKIPQGALLAVIRYPSKGADRRGQTINPGVYTMRYSLYPVNGSHQGVAPQRDFLLLVPAAMDKDPAALPDYDHLVAMSDKASGTPHPAVFSIETPLEGAAIPGLAKEGENDWVLNTKVGSTPIGIILVGTYQG